MGSCLPTKKEKKLISALNLKLLHVKLGSPYENRKPIAPLNSNLTKSRSPITSLSVAQSFWNVAWSTAVILPCPVWIFKTLTQLRKSIWVNGILQLDVVTSSGSFIFWHNLNPVWNWNTSCVRRSLFALIKEVVLNVLNSFRPDDASVQLLVLSLIRQNDTDMFYMLNSSLLG